MMLRIEDITIYLSENPVIVRQTKTQDALDSGGDFSYAFTVDRTSEVNKAFDSFTVSEKEAVILSDSGIQLFKGIVSVDQVRENFIDCSFISGNTEWFVMLNNLLV